MAKRQYNIKWRESDEKELARRVKNFNAKLTRLYKQQPDKIPVLPEKIKLSDLKKGITTRDEYNRTIKSLSKFSERGSETLVKSKRGAEATKWEVREYKLRQVRLNRMRQKEKERLLEKPVTSRGKDTGSKRSQMGTIRDNELKPSKRKFENTSQKEWDLFKKSVDAKLDPLHSEYAKYNMKQNYIKGLINAGYSTDLVDTVRQIPVDKFIDTVRTDTEASFDFIYDPIEHKLKENALLETWKNALANLHKAGE